MSTTSTAPEEETAPGESSGSEDTRSATSPPSGGGRGDHTGGLRWFIRWFGTPLLVTGSLVGLYVYVQGQELDSVEQRVLTRDFILEALQTHVTLTLVSTFFVLLLAVPLGIAATRPGRERFAATVIGIGNAGQAIPSLGLLAILFYAFGQTDWLPLPSTGFVPVVIALTLYSFLPILRNTMVGLRGVDESVLEAGSGMGMSNRQVLRQLELPLAVPVILAGVRTALVINVGTAALAFLFGGGGLGLIIFRGYQLNRTPVVMVGAVLTAALALFIDWLAGVAEEELTPAGI